MQILSDKDQDLLDIDVNERTITHKLAEYLQNQFIDYNVDCEYNRYLEDIKKLRIEFKAKNALSIYLKTRKISILSKEGFKNFGEL